MWFLGVVDEFFDSVIGDLGIVCVVICYWIGIGGVCDG